MAAAKKKKRGKQGIVSKVLNGLLLALAFARPLERAFAGQWSYFTTVQQGSLVDEATFGLVSGKFSLAAGAKLYGPAGASAALGYIKSWAMRRYPIRG